MRSCKPFLTIVMLCAFLTLDAGKAHSSDLTGVYAIVEKVVFEPNSVSPERVQVWGVFSTAGSMGLAFRPAIYGYMYYEVSPGREAATWAEWRDLNALAGSGRVVTYGSSINSYAFVNGRVRAATAKPEEPDPYPSNIGINGRDVRTNVEPDLREALRAKRTPPQDVRIEGRVVLASATPLSFSPFVVAESADGFQFGSSRSGQIPSAGSAFHLILVAGTYRLRMHVPAGSYIVSMMQGTQNVYDSGLVVSNVRNGALPPLVVTVNSGTASYRGTVMNGDRAASLSFVMLAPSQASRQSNAYRYHSVIADDYGRFSIGEIEPGEYKLFVWNRQPNVPFTNAAFLATHDSEAQTLSLAPQANIDVKLTAVPFRP